MGKRSVEDIKRESEHLRGTIAQEAASDSTHFDADTTQLLKFHGTYQQDDRDLRLPRKKAGEEPAYMMMVRSAIPGGALSAEQYLTHDRCAGEFGDGTLRITSRQGFQLHGVLKGDLQAHIRALHASGITTWNACGDCTRNTMATPVPVDDAAHRDAQDLAREIAVTFRAKSGAYTQIWIDGERVTEAPAGEEEPIYGETYLPRKFKMGIAIPPRNDVDLYSQDVGLAPHVEGGAVTAYTVLVGGGFGMTHNKEETYPCLAQPLATVNRGVVIEVLRAIITTQRDHGNRENRKRARMKYLIDERGMDWFRDEVKSRLDGVTLEPPRGLTWDTVGDPLGWHEQGDGNWFCGVWVEDGRIKDEGERRWRSGFRKIAEEIGCPLRLTPNTNVLFHDIAPDRRERLDAILAGHGIAHGDDFTPTTQTSQACVALPTCGLALAESERQFPETLGEINTVLKDLGLESEPLLVRMTGCPNGCARPYNADFGLVGRSPGKYALYVGGSHRGDRLAGLYEKTVPVDQVPEKIRAILTEFKAGRSEGESFTDWWGRTHANGERPSSEHFHVELAERAEKLGGARPAE